jgi:hypothetical protein
MVLAVAVVAACSGGDQGPIVTGTTTTTSSPSTNAAPSPTGTATTSAGPSVGPPTDPPILPDGVPEVFDDDVPARDLPVGELVPPGDEVTAVARTRRGDVEGVVISFATPGPDPFRAARGFVVWRRDPGGDPPWRALYGVSHRARDGVLAISAEATDLTGDGAADALIREETGGSGQCATYRVVDLVAGSQIWRRAVCDAEIQPNPDPIGLFEIARIYEPDDAHCCPSAIRERVLTWNGERFVVASEAQTAL